MYLAFYISSHGFGHMTRCLGIIENILKASDYKIYIVCDKKQNDFAKIYLSTFKDRIIYNDLETDIGLINKENSLEVDKVKLEKKLTEFISNLDDATDKECKFLKKLNVKSVICDISPIGCIVGNKLNLPTIFISNFSWIEQYEYIGINKDIIDKFRLAYSYIDKFIKYELCLCLDSIDYKEAYETGFVCREIDESKVEDIRSKYGKSIFITCGKSASLDYTNVKNFSGTIFTTSGIDIKCDDANIVNLPIDVLDTQNYIAASDMIISKAGWGTIAEGIIGNTPLVLIERPSAKEDSFNISKIKEYKLGISITEDKLKDIDMIEVRNSLEEKVDYRNLNSYKNNTRKVVSLILLSRLIQIY